MQRGTQGRPEDGAAPPDEGGRRGPARAGAEDARAPVPAAVRAAAERFPLPGRLEEALPAGSGHIHETWELRARGAGGVRRAILQRLNTRVFRDPGALLENFERVTAHLRARLARRGVEDAERRVPRSLPTREGGTAWRDPEGGLWRCQAYVEGTRSLDVAREPAVAREAARAFGRFVALLADWEGPPPRETLPRFHDLAERRARLERALRADPLGRAARARDVVARVSEAAAGVDERLEAVGALRLPRRVVHNDCKLNNVLLDAESGEGLCVIDLDTVMEGTVVVDFGELARTACCPAPEDERDLSRVRFDLPRFRAAAAGWLEGAGEALVGVERSALAPAPAVMALENAVRFLTDHLEGDTYFRVHRPGHNLDRARAQAALCREVLAVQDEARSAVEEAVREVSPRRG